MTRACAPGKIILLGEHAVVYGRPALAVPLRQVRACARIEPAADGSPGWLLLDAPDLAFEAWLHQAPPDHPLAIAAGAALETLSPGAFEPLRLTVESDIPVASGLGSSAAVSVAIVRAINQHFGGRLSTSRISELAYRVEVFHHGTPSGIDNTVVAYDQPVYFVRGHSPEPLPIGGRFHLVVGDTGIAAPTAVAVAHVRRCREADPAAVNIVFDSIAALVTEARQAIVAGDAPRLGACMARNHTLLSDLGVSSSELDSLVQAALAAGAHGAKMSGGGMGGNMVAVVPGERSLAVAEALGHAGAVRVIRSEVAP